MTFSDCLTAASIRSKDAPINERDGSTALAACRESGFSHRRVITSRSCVTYTRRSSMRRRSRCVLIASKIEGPYQPVSVQRLRDKIKRPLTKCPLGQLHFFLSRHQKDRGAGSCFKDTGEPSTWQNLRVCANVAVTPLALFSTKEDKVHIPKILPGSPCYPKAVGHPDFETSENRVWRLRGIPNDERRAFFRGLPWVILQHGGCMRLRRDLSKHNSSSAHS